VQAANQRADRSYDHHVALANAREFCITGQWDANLIIYGKRRPPFPQHIASALASSDAAVKAVVREPSSCVAYALDAAEAAMASLEEDPIRSRFVGQFCEESKQDYERLLNLHLGSYPELGSRIDPHVDGPLGDLWTREPPPGIGHEYQFASRQLDSTDEIEQDRPTISVCFDGAADITKEEMLLVLKYLSEVYRDGGGNGLVVVDGYSYSPSVQPEAVS
jgi:hypothetical protein